MFYKEFPEIKVDTEYLTEIAQGVIRDNLWRSIRRVKRDGEIDFEFSGVDAVNDTDMTKRREYLGKVVFAYQLTPDQRERAGIKADTAWLFKTNEFTRVYIHRESRALALNFPLIFEPGKSFVGFYDDAGQELDRHTLNEPNAVYYNVENWHTVINESTTSPRVVLTCSDLTGEWRNIVCGV